MFQGKKNPVKGKNMHLYYASKGLKKDELICKGTYNCEMEDFFNAGYECYDFGYCQKVKADNPEVLQSVIEPYAGFVEGINDIPFTQANIFKAFKRKAYLYDDESYNKKLSSFMNIGVVDFGEAMNMWRGSILEPTPVIKQEAKKEPIFVTKNEYTQESLRGWGTYENARSC